VGFFHVQAAYAVTAGSPGAKAVLVCIADRACDTCGMAWPGRQYLADRTELDPRRISVHLATLVRSGLLEVHGYGSGGRGVSTEYVVLPKVAKLSTAPCPKCAKLSKTWTKTTGLKPGNLDATAKKTWTKSTNHQSENLSIRLSVSEHHSETPPQNPGGSQSTLSRESQHSAPIPTEARDFLRSLGVHPNTPPRGETLGHPPEAKPGQGRKRGSVLGGEPKPGSES
jgi:hypothetical protein